MFVVRIVTSLLFTAIIFNIFSCFCTLMLKVTYIYIYNQSVDSSCFALWELISTAPQMKILKGQSAQTTAGVVSVAYCWWPPFLINRVLNLTKLRSVIYDQSVDSSCFVLQELISTAQMKWRSWRTRMLKLLNSSSISDKETSLNKNGVVAAN